MLVLSFKMSKLKLFIISVTILVSILFITNVLNKTSMVQSKPNNKQQTYIVTNNQDRLNFLKGFGWEIANDPIEVSDVIIPVEFDLVYEKYNQIQKEQGFDLTKYKGKTCKRWIYEVKNHSKQEQNVVASILVYNDVIIGGDICSKNIDGFMHGFKYQP